MKKSVFLGLLVMVLTFGLIGCDTGGGTTTYTVSIGTLTNGSISANPTRGVEGTEIILTIIPDNGYRLKSNTLRFGTTAINEEILKFYLPAENVTVTAEFELDNPLPEPSGINELGGRTFTTEDREIVFNINGTYTLSEIFGNDFPTITEAGVYSWDAISRTAILLAEKVMFEGGGELLDKGEYELHLRDYFTANPDDMPSGYSMQEIIEAHLNAAFSLQTFHYEIANNVIFSFWASHILEDTGTTIAGLAYSTMVGSGGFGVHYLLAVSYEEALLVLTEKYGQPEDGWALQSHSALSRVNEPWVILETTRFRDFRLHRRVPGGESDITKGWAGW